MSNQIAGDAVSRCRLQHVVNLRVVTFTTARDKEKEPETYADDWTPFILIQITDANRIFNRYGILIRQGHREDIPVEESRNILASSRANQILLEGYPPHRQREILETGQLDIRGEDGRPAVTSEVERILRINRGQNHEICSYWVPSLDVYGIAYFHEFFPGI